MDFDLLHHLRTRTLLAQLAPTDDLPCQFLSRLHVLHEVASRETSIADHLPLQISFVSNNLFE